MNRANLIKWVVEKLVPNHLSQAVIVLVHIPCHSFQVDKTILSLKMRAFWGIAVCSLGVDPCFRDVYCLRQVPLKPEEVFKIDSILPDYGHTAVGLSPCICDLNPTELVGAKIKRIGRECNVTADLSVQKLLQTTNDAIG
jgi:hypothetical protein